MIEQNDEKQEVSHKRLRDTCREHEGWVVRLERKLTELELQIATIKATPPEAAKLRFSSSIVFGIVAVSISAGASIWASNSGLRSDLHDVMNKIDNANKTADERERNQKKIIYLTKVNGFDKLVLSEPRHHDLFGFSRFGAADAPARIRRSRSFRIDFNRSDVDARCNGFVGFLVGIYDVT